jgi:hypothetical protein
LRPKVTGLNSHFDGDFISDPRLISEWPGPYPESSYHQKRLKNVDVAHLLIICLYFKETLF